MAYKRSIDAFTRLELFVVITLLIILGVFIPTMLFQNRKASERIWCVNNLMQVGTAYRLWANDNGDHFPSLTSITNGGWKELANSPRGGGCCWTNYLILARDLTNPSVLVCPADHRRPASSISNLVNKNISYFVDVDANDTYPQSLLAGDRNLGPGTTPASDYGFSPADGTGNDVVVKGPVCWSLKMHSRGNPAGAGNILLGDGSAQQVTSANLNVNWLPHGGVPARGNPTNAPIIRLVFP
jgi:competence protein ComGC